MRKRTHSMLRAAGINEPNVIPSSEFRGSCAKMFFDCKEVAGATAVTDTIAGSVLTPGLIDFQKTNAVRLRTDINSGLFGGIALTSGTLPAIGTKDFILFAVKHNPDFGSRQDGIITLQDVSGSSAGGLHIFDGDGASIDNSGETQSGTETNAVKTNTEVPFDQSIGLIRNGSSIGHWNMCDSLSTEVFPGNTINQGDVYMRLARNKGFINTQAGADPTTFGKWGRNDRGIPDTIIATWQGSADDPRTRITKWGDLDFGGDGGLPGVWSYIDPAFSVPQANLIKISWSSTYFSDYYGIALFVFENGLPSDFKEALRQMTLWWWRGDKYIWPNWISVL